MKGETKHVKSRWSVEGGQGRTEALLAVYRYEDNCFFARNKCLTPQSVKSFFLLRGSFAVNFHII